MEVKIYEQEKAKYKNSKIVKCVFREFNQKQDKISDFKLIFILQNGEYLLVPFLEQDNCERVDEEYDHIVYIPIALELIIEKLGYNKEKFIEEKIENFTQEELISVILNLNIAIIYNASIYDKEDDLKDMNLFFGKPLKISERQKKAFPLLRDSIEKEKFKIGIMKLEKDKNLRDYEQLNLVESGNIQYLWAEGTSTIDFDNLLHILDIDIETQR